MKDHKIKITKNDPAFFHKKLFRFFSKKWGRSLFLGTFYHKIFDIFLQNNCDQKVTKFSSEINLPVRLRLLFFFFKFLIFNFFPRNDAICTNFVVWFENVIFMPVYRFCGRATGSAVSFGLPQAEIFLREHWIFYIACRWKKFVFFGVGRGGQNGAMYIQLQAKTICFWEGLKLCHIYTHFL